MRHILFVLTAIPSLALAQDFAPMSGTEIETALSDRSLVYSGGETQDFRASGATLYTAGRPSWGYWAVRDDQYCSQWPPSDGWTCYDMMRSGDRFRFLAEDGSFSEGAYAE